MRGVLQQPFLSLPMDVAEEALTLFNAIQRFMGDPSIRLILHGVGTGTYTLTLYRIYFYSIVLGRTILLGQYSTSVSTPSSPSKIVL